MTEPRLIITAKYLIEKFGHMDTEMLLAVIGPFCVDDYLLVMDYFQTRIEEIDEQPDAPGKQGARDAWFHMREAYRKMSDAERSRISKELPGELARHLEKR